VAHGSPVSILMVCMGNICRSPTAEGVLRELARREAPELMLRIDSAGTHDYHVGAPPDPRTLAAASSRGFRLDELRARQIERADFARFDLLLAMDRDNLSRMLRLAPAGSESRARLFLDYAPGQPLREVPDPYYGGEADFARVLDLVEAASRGLIASLRER
jgi:protein-tyrosine phosphatase